MRKAGRSERHISSAIWSWSRWLRPWAAAIADRLGAARTATGFAIITFFFAVGQVIAPVAAGYLADVTNSFTQSYTASGCLTALGILLAQRMLTRSPRSIPAAAAD